MDATLLQEQLRQSEQRNEALASSQSPPAGACNPSGRGSLAASRPAPGPFLLAHDPRRRPPVRAPCLSRALILDSRSAGSPSCGLSAPVVSCTDRCGGNGWLISCSSSSITDSHWRLTTCCPTMPAPRPISMQANMKYVPPWPILAPQCGHTERLRKTARHHFLQRAGLLFAFFMIRSSRLQRRARGRFLRPPRGFRVRHHVSRLV